MYSSNQALTAGSLGSLAGNAPSTIPPPSLKLLDDAASRVSQLIEFLRQERDRVRSFADSVLGVKPETHGASPPDIKISFPRGESLIRAIDDLALEIQRLQGETDRLSAI